MATLFAALSEKKRPVQLVKQEFPKEVQEYNLVPKAEKIIDANGVQVDSIAYDVVKGRKYNIKDYIASFSDDVGIQNILRKVAMSGDKSYLNQTGRVPLNKDGGLEPIQDYSNVPGSKTEAFNAVAAGVAAYDSLPEDIKGKMSFAQFAEEFGQEQYKAFVDKIIAAYNAQNEKKGEDK